VLFYLTLIDLKKCAVEFFAKFNGTNSLRNHLSEVRKQDYSVSLPFNYYADTGYYSEKVVPFRLGALKSVKQLK
jgi:hypothetical protein